MWPGLITTTLALPSVTGGALDAEDEAAVGDAVRRRVDDVWWVGVAERATDADVGPAGTDAVVRDARGVNVTGGEEDGAGPPELHPASAVASTIISAGADPARRSGLRLSTATTIACIRTGDCQASRLP